MRRIGFWQWMLVFSVFSASTHALDVVFEGVPLREVLTQLNAASGWQLTSSLSGDLPIRFAVEDASIETVMEALAKHTDAVFERTAEGGHLRRPSEVRVIQSRPLKHRSADELDTLLTDRMTASVIVDAATNRLILDGTDADVMQALRLIDALDVPVRQILIEAKLVSIDTHARQDLGIRWQLMGQRGRLTAQGQTAGRALGAEAGQLAVSIVEHPHLLALELAALEASGSGEVISEPRVVTTNRRQATIRQGQQVPFITRDQDGVPKTEFKDAVLELNVTPVLRDDGQIELRLAIRQDQVSALATDAGPAIETRALDTDVTVQPNETLVLGGIYESRQEEVVTGLPGLSQLPVIGRAFQTREHRAVKSELLLFITPRLL
ncbi:MAG: hypothetical protein EBS77_00970 [Gammaproteobacteria bacterium]|nr:hypothetical protein [Gammaproteobacteria bacterium]